MKLKRKVKIIFTLLTTLIAFTSVSFNGFSQNVQTMQDGSLKITDPNGDIGTYKKVSKFLDGSIMNDSMLDGVVYRKIQGKYVRREFTRGVDLSWYNLNRKATSRKTIALDSAIKMANLLALPVIVPIGTLNLRPSLVPKKGFSGPGIIQYKGSYIYNPKTDYLGIPQNIDEVSYVYPKLFKDGPILQPGLAKRPLNTINVDILAHWYNDFGLSSTALARNQTNGSYIWYDWSWNFSNNPNYDPARHPLLGWYKGDDPKVLDWISYWLVKYGLTGVIIDHSFNTANWSNPKDKSYWVYQLFNHTPNFNSLKYVVWLSSTHGMAVETAKARDSDMINNVLGRYKNVYCYERSGKRYPVFYMWDMEGVRGIYDKYNGAKNSIAYLKKLSKMCVSLGYDGICIYGRNLSHNEKLYGNPKYKQELKDSGVYLFSQDYSTTYEKTSGGYNGQYATYVNNVQFPKDPEYVLGVLTSAKTQKPHPSNWKLAGTTPKLFEALLRKAVSVTNTTDKPKTVVVYNISEWAEAGPGLIPNQKDLFGYLEAVSNVKKGQ
jgi:hypothetical protein